ncbi:MAG: phosphotransferase [Polyangiaceae bacterium]|nr:phosphotransferase [Polyangiaceae bacterium]
MLRFAEHFPPERVESLARAEALLGHLRGLPRGPETHGLTHGDLHQGNLHRAADGSLMAFDFDDCVYHHAVSEVAVVLYYATGRGAQGQGAAAKAQLAEHFLEHFLGGYMTEDTLTRAQLEQLPDWLLLRSALLTSVVETNVVTHLEDKAKALDMYHGRLEGKEAVIELDFGRLARVWGR